MKKLVVSFLLVVSCNLYSRPVGLANCGASCYLNAATQSLLNLKELNNTLLKLDINPENQFAFAYQQLLNEIKTTKALKLENNNKALKAYRDIGFALITEQTRLAPNSQEDASEFFVLAFNALKNSSLELDGLISNNFGFFQTKKTKCPNPFDTSHILTYYTQVQNPEFNLALPIQNGIASLKSVDECLEHYFQEETFDDPDNYISFQGNIPGLEYLIGQPIANCTQKTYLINAPDTLLISLKRTGWDDKTRQPIRFSHAVVISSPLSIRPYVKEIFSSESYEYTPISIIVQTGGVKAGHYRAYIQENGIWYLCDDSTITQIQGTGDNPISAAMQKDIDDNAYVIFYKKINLSEESQWAKKLHELHQKPLQQQLTNLKNSLDSLQRHLKAP